MNIVDLSKTSEFIRVVNNESFVTNTFATFITHFQANVDFTDNLNLKRCVYDDYVYKIIADKNFAYLWNSEKTYCEDGIKAFPDIEIILTFKNKTSHIKEYGIQVKFDIVKKGIYLISC